MNVLSGPQDRLSLHGTGAIFGILTCISVRSTRGVIVFRIQIGTPSDPSERQAARTR